MTEEVLVYPDHDDEDDVIHANETNDDATPVTGSNNSTNTQRKKLPWYKRLPHLRLTHIRFYALLQLLLLLDIFAVAHCALSVATDGPSVSILFGFEFAILLVSVLSAMGMYHMHVIDGLMGFLHHVVEGEHHYCPVGGMAEGGPVEEGGETNTEEDADAIEENSGNQNESTDTTSPPTARPKTLAKTLVERIANPWRDRRATLSFAIELMAQAAKFLFYIVFFAIVFTYYGMPINIFREVYVSFQQLRRRLMAFNNYRRLTHNMDKRFESIQDEEELDRLGHTCIICRDQMDLLGGCKKLPGCGHAFHTHCLREWLVQQQTCPTCRADIAANEARRKKELERESAAEVLEATIETQETGVEGRDAAAMTTQSDGTTNQNATRETQQPPEQTAQPAAADLPLGWNEAIDLATGKTYYYNKQTGVRTWDKPSMDAPSSNPPSSVATGNVSFPCLYRVASPLGAPVFPAHASPNAFGGAQMFASPSPPVRIIPRGRVIVCTSIESWLHDSMLCMPDGYVRGIDVEILFALPSGKGDETQQRNAEVAA